MTENLKGLNILSLPEELDKRRRILLGELKSRTLWFIRLRWWVPPAIVIGMFAARIIGFEFQWRALVVLAIIVLAYNLIFYIINRLMMKEDIEQRSFIFQFTYWQVAADLMAMLFLAHFTGGAASPFIFFFIFHIIFASILLPTKWAYVFAALTSAGMVCLASVEYLNWIPHHALYFNGKAIDLAAQPPHLAVELLFFSASLFITAFFSISIQRMLRKRIIHLSDLSETVIDLNDKLESLHAMMRAIGSGHSLKKLLNIAAKELATVMKVKGTSIKLLSEEGSHLRYEAAYGLPESLLREKTVEVAKSPLNQSIIGGKSFVTGNVTEKEMFQFGEDLEKADVQSVLFVPLTENNSVIGILGAYSRKRERFCRDDVEFFKLAAEVVAVALENVRAYESVKTLIDERNWFLMRVAHNLRAPLGAIVSMIEVVREGYVGDLANDQEEHLRRAVRRARTMITTINELLLLADGRSGRLKKKHELVDLSNIAGRLHRTFQDEAEKKRLKWKLKVADDLPAFRGNADMIEQMLENLISNAVKYTPSGGSVSLEIFREPDGQIRIDVRDTGIGIPTEAQSSIFHEFYRANNAKEMDELGTGLGLAIVKEIVEHHQGRIKVESIEGLVTVISIFLPVSAKEPEDDAN